MEVQVCDLAVARAGVPVLEGISFGLSGGQALVLRGPNGVGKTTLLRVVAGLQAAFAGQVVVGEVAYAGHADGVKASLTVAENLAFWARIYGGGDVGAAMVALNLQGLAGRLAGQLSAGQRRRLGLARLLVAGRKVWLLDEPTVSLDAGAVALFGAVVAAHLSGGGVALIASHIDLGFAAQVLDLAPYRAKAPVMPGFDEAFG